MTSVGGTKGASNPRSSRRCAPTIPAAGTVAGIAAASPPTPPPPPSDNQAVNSDDTESVTASPTDNDTNSEISTHADRGPRSWVCAHETLRSAPIDVSGNFPARVSAESP